MAISTFRMTISSLSFQNTTKLLMNNFINNEKRCRDVPYVTWMLDGDFPSTQCVAVRTHSGFINEPPQNCRPSRVRSKTCQGQELMGATVPPTISVDRVGRLPQISVKIMT